MSSNDRDPAFDIIKGILMYFVVISHLFDTFLQRMALFVDGMIPAFFIISGYFMKDCTDVEQLKRTIQKKTKTLLIPYLIWSAVSLVANVVFGIMSGKPVGVLNEAVQIFLYARSLWFLIALYISAFLFTLSTLIINKMKWNIYLVQFLLWIVLCITMPDQLLCMYKVKWLYPFFVFGYWLKHAHAFDAHRISRRMIVLFSVVFTGLLVCACRMEEEFLNFIRFQYSSLSGVAFGMAFYILCTLFCVLAVLAMQQLGKTRIGPVLTEIGTYNLDIYVIHMFLVKLIAIPVFFSDMLLQAGVLVKYLLIYACAALIVAIIWLGCKWVLRKIPLYLISTGNT